MLSDPDGAVDDRNLKIMRTGLKIEKEDPGNYDLLFNITPTNYYARN